MRYLKKGQVEMKLRSESESSAIPLDDATALIEEKVKALYDSIK
jgi:hypothetical protein